MMQKQLAAVRNGLKGAKDDANIMKEKIHTLRNTLRNMGSETMIDLFKRHGALCHKP